MAKPHGNALLDVLTVMEIRDLRGRLSASQVASLFNIGKSTVLDIWHGRTWRKFIG